MQGPSGIGFASAVGHVVDQIGRVADLAGEVLRGVVLAQGVLGAMYQKV